MIVLYVMKIYKLFNYNKYIDVNVFNKIKYVYNVCNKLFN